MKHTPPSPNQGVSFDALVARARSSEPQLSSTELDGMVQRFEARLKLEAAQPPQSPAGNPAPAAARAGKLGATGKTLLGGASVAAVAVLIYGATFGTNPEPAPDSAPQLAQSQPAAPATGATSAFTNRGSAIENQDVAEAAPAANAATMSESAAAAGRAKPQRTSATNSARVERTRASAPALTTPAINPKPAIAPTAPDAPVAEQAPSAAEPAVVTKPQPALDTSLTQLERAERELRSGNPSAALTTLALPVVPSLTSRVEALRAVALCQSGQTAAGRRLATQHLVRNPRSPYEQRLQRACGDI